MTFPIGHRANDPIAPQEVPLVGGGTLCKGGLTIREEYALQILKQLVVSSERREIPRAQATEHARKLVRGAVTYADLLLEELAK